MGLPEEKRSGGNWGGRGNGGFGPASNNPMMMMMQMMMGGGPYGKGGGKGGRGEAQSLIGKTPKERLMWIGGLGDATHDKEFNKELQQFFNNKVGGCKYVQTNKMSGTAIFDTEENK